jgi:hypothetical protein
VQQYSACDAEVVLDAAAPLPRLSSFAQWLAGHAGLVRKIAIRLVNLKDRVRDEGEPFEEHLKHAQELLQLSIHTAATLPSTAGGIPTAAAAPAAVPAASELPLAAAAAKTATRKRAALTGPASSAKQRQQQQQRIWQQKQQQGNLRLRSFSSSLPKAVSLLEVLRPHHLTQLDLDLRNAVTDNATLPAALLQLSSLQELRLGGMPDNELYVGRALTALAQLNHLTSLHLDGSWPEDSNHDCGAPYVLAQPVARWLQQLLAQPLPLQKLQLSIDCNLPVLDMSNLTKLTELVNQ